MSPGLRVCLAAVATVGALGPLAAGCDNPPSLQLTVLRSPVLDEAPLAGVDTLELRLAQPGAEPLVEQIAFHAGPTIDLELPALADGARLEVAAIADGAVVAVGRTAPLAAMQKTAPVYFGRVDRFSAAPTAPPADAARFGASATVLGDGRVLLAGGATAGSPDVPDAAAISARADIYDPATGRFSAVAGASGAMATGPFAARIFHAAVAMPDGGALLLGGLGSAGPRDDIVRFDPQASTFTAAGKLPGPRFAAAAALADGDVLLVGGYAAPDGLGGGTLQPDALLVAPDGSATSIALPSPRAYAVATPLADGRVLVTGGVDDQGPRDDALLYDPARRSFAAPTPSGAARATMLAARVGHSATRLPSGAVFVFGGNDGHSSVAAPELFSPAAGGFVAPPTRNLTERQHQAAVALADGSVLVAGGELSPQQLAVPAPVRELLRFAPSAASSGVLSTDLPPGPERADGNALLLPDGSVLYVGGAVGNPRLLAGGAEIFVPCFGACLVVTP